jgi:hypothetical protein
MAAIDTAATTYVDTPLIKSKRQRYEMMRGAYWSDRASFDAHWRDLGDFLLPRRTRFWPGDRNRGGSRNQNIIDSTGRFAARTLMSGLHAGLTSPARPWMQLTTPDPDLAEFEPVKEWLHLVTQRMLTIFLQSNLYNALPILYGDMGVFGTAAMAVMEDRDVFRCYSYPIGSYAIGLDERGIVTTFIREYELTVRQVVATFGVTPGSRDIDWSHISTIVKDLWNRSNYEAAVQVCWVVLPNEEPRNDRLEAKYLPWTSCHWERNAPIGNQTDLFLRESGFRSFPIMAPRWDVSSPEDSYGVDCPGMTALGDIKQLQIMQRRKGQAIAKMIDPPLTGPSALRTQKTSLLPGDITYVDVREGQQGLRSIHEVRIDLSHLTADIGQTQNRIQRAFYEDLFLMLAQSDESRGTQPITAREVAERHEEKLLALGPVLERTNDELLNPLVDRVYALMVTNGLIPRAPDVLNGVTLKVEYTSILAQAQKLVGVVSLDRFMQTMGGMIGVYPEVRHKINVYEVVDIYGDMLGVDPRIIVSTDDAKAAVEAEAQQQQQAAAAEQAVKATQAAKNAAQAPVGGDTALTRILQGVGGAPGAPAQ